MYVDTDIGPVACSLEKLVESNEHAENNDADHDGISDDFF